MKNDKRVLNVQTENTKPSEYEDLEITLKPTNKPTCLLGSFAEYEKFIFEEYRKLIK